MAYKRLTMQDIADACKLSRNTVSKIFNDRGAVPEATRRMVLQKARELGYYQGVEDVPPRPVAQGKTLPYSPDGSHRMPISARSFCRLLRNTSAALVIP